MILNAMASIRNSKSKYNQRISKLETAKEIQEEVFLRVFLIIILHHEPTRQYLKFLQKKSHVLRDHKTRSIAQGQGPRPSHISFKKTSLVVNIKSPKLWLWYTLDNKCLLIFPLSVLSLVLIKGLAETLMPELLSY